MRRNGTHSGPSQLPGTRTPATLTRAPFYIPEVDFEQCFPSRTVSLRAVCRAARAAHRRQAPGLRSGCLRDAPVVSCNAVSRPKRRPAHSRRTGRRVADAWPRFGQSDARRADTGDDIAGQRDRGACAPRAAVCERARTRDVRGGRRPDRGGADGGAPARHRQARHSRSSPAQARTADARGIRAGQASRGDRRGHAGRDRLRRPARGDRAPSSRELGRHRLPRRAGRRPHPVRRPAAGDRRLLRRVDVGASLPEGAAARSRAQDDRRAAQHELRSSGLRRLPARRAEPSRHHCPAAAGRRPLVRVPAATFRGWREPRSAAGPDLQDTAVRLARLRAGRGAVRRRSARGLGDGGALRPGRAVRACCSGSPC